MLGNFKNRNVQKYLEGPDPSASTDYFLWKATRSISKSLQSQTPIRKADNSWAKNDRTKTETFATHLDNQTF